MTLPFPLPREYHSFPIAGLNVAQPISPSAFPLPTFRAQLQASILPGTQVYQLEVISLLLMITVLGKPKILSMKLVFCIWIPLGGKSYKFFPLLLLFKVSFSLGISSECLIYGSPDKGWSPKSSFFFKFFWLHLGACRILVPDQGSNPHPLHWKSRVLTAGAPGKCQNVTSLDFESWQGPYVCNFSCFFLAFYIEDPGTVVWRDLPSSRSSLMLLLTADSWLQIIADWECILPRPLWLCPIAWVNDSDCTALHPGLYVLPPASTETF